MQEKANVSLSAFEQQLVNDPAWILTKNRIIEKVYLLFGYLSERYRQTASVQNLPAAVTATAPKISKGENYEGLPYVMLDYPRCFGKEDVFAVRTFFWWGHYFSITLQLKGVYLQQYLPALLNNEKILRGNDVWMNVRNEEWQHHFRSNNMLLLNEHTETLQDKKVLKLAFLCSLKNWDEAETNLTEKFQLLVNAVTENLTANTVK